MSDRSLVTSPESASGRDSDRSCAVSVVPACARSGDAALPPLWLLDVDGVLNAVCGTVPPGYVRERINGFAITWNPTVIERIGDLHTSGAVEVRWLTTWCELAVSHIAPGLGLPLDFVVEGAKDHRGTDHKTWWKSPAAKRLSDAEPNRALIWTDDDLEDAERNGEVAWLRERTGPTFALAPDWRCGLTPKHLARIEAFAERARQGVTQ